MLTGYLLRAGVLLTQAKRKMVLVPLIAVALLAGCAPAAQPTSGPSGAPPSKGEAREATNIALYRGPDRQQVLEEGAKREGELLLYATGTQIQPLLDAFMKKYPFIKVQMYQGGSDEIARRAVEEAKAGRHQVDAFELAIAGLLVPRDEGVLQPFFSPELEAYPDEAKDRQGHWVVVRESYISLGWNTNLIDSAEAPRTYRDLVNPKWRGKMAVSGSPSTAANWVGAMVLAEGRDFVRQFAQQQVAVHNITSRALADLMVAGEVAMSPTTYSSHVAASRAKGAPLDWAPLDPVPVTDTAYAIAARAPHPHAALLLADFLLSRQGQELYATLGYDSARSDMGQGGRTFKKVYLSARPNYVQEYEDWVRLFQEVFLRKS